MPPQIGKQQIGHLAAEPLLDDDAQDGEVFAVPGKGIGRHKPAAIAQPFREIEDVEVRLLFQDKGEDRELVAATDEPERPHFGNLGREMQGNVLASLLNARIAGPAEAEEVVVLGDDLVAGTREIQGEGGHLAAEVVHVKDEIIGQLVFVAPDDPADAGIDKTVFMAGGIDGLDARNTEVPFEVRLQKWRDEASAGGIDVDGNIEALLLLQLIEGVADLADRLVAAVEGTAQNRHNADSVFVAELYDFFCAKMIALPLHRHEARLDVPIATKFLPADLHIDAHHEIRTISGLARCLHALALAFLDGESTEHTGLAGADGRATGCRLVLGRVPEARDHINATHLQLRRLG